MVLQETRIQLSKVVLMRDALTGEPVSSGVRMHSLSGGCVEKKPGGYVLFLGVNAPEIKIEVESPIYQPRSICLKADQGEELEELLMYPSPAYPRRTGYTAVRGSAEPGSALRFHIEDERGVCRLFHDYKKGEEQISFYVKKKTEGTLWYIRKKKAASGVYFSLKSRPEDSEVYCLREPLDLNYPIKDTVIYPAQETVVAEDGTFYMLLPELPEETCLLHYSCNKAGEEKQREIRIVRAAENLITEED